MPFATVSPCNGGTAGIPARQLGEGARPFNIQSEMVDRACPKTGYFEAAAPGGLRLAMPVGAVWRKFLRFRWRSARSSARLHDSLRLPDTAPPRRPLRSIISGEHCPRICVRQLLAVRLRPLAAAGRVPSGRSPRGCGSTLPSRPSSPGARSLSRARACP